MTEIILRNISWTLLTLVLAQAPGYAQTPDSSPGPVELGIALGTMAPVGGFRRNVGNGSFSEREAVAFNLIVHMTRFDLIRLRCDLLLGDYQHDSVYKQIYELSSFSLGPEVGLPIGPARPYVSAEYGRLSFHVGAWLTEEERHRIGESIQGTGEWVYSGGVRIPVGPTKRWAIDVGLRYHDGGTASYLLDGSIQKNPDGSINTIIPTRSSTPFVMYMLGIQLRPRIHE